MDGIREIQNPYPYYNGPWFDFGTATYSALGFHIANTRHACVNWFHDSSGQARPDTAAIVDCMQNNLDLPNAANAASHTYFLTLWPAFVSAIAALGPDGGQIAYDNVIWSAIFAVSSGAIPGSESVSLPHHLNALTLNEARDMCAHWQDNESNLHKSSRRGRFRAGRYASEYINYALAFVCVGLWAAFIAWYSISLLNAQYYSSILPPLYGIIWYLIAAAPALFKAILRIVLNNIELWEPIRSSTPEPQNSTSTTMPENSESKVEELPTIDPNNNNPMSHPTSNNTHQHHSNPSFSATTQFRKVQHTTGLQTWTRIVHLQFLRRPYRILVRPNEPHWLDNIAQYCYRMGQLTIFVWGSMVQGGVLFLDTPTDYYLTFFLVFTTATPRLVWPWFWKRGASGADLVVWVRPAF